jgi:hypothetical protein
MYRFWLTTVCAVAGLTVIGAPTALAQIIAPAGGMSTPVTNTLNRNLTKGPASGPAAPPVLPGTKAAPEAAAPTTSPTDMSPTEALFDAINRGDLPGARDAVNRGAQLDARNELGMTALDQSVDTGRNDITFMLLSMRSDSPTARNVARAGTAGGDLFTRGAPPEASRAPIRPRVVAVSSREPADDEPAVATPRYSSGDGGAPIPAAGFVGFNGR